MKNNSKKLFLFSMSLVTALSLTIGHVKAITVSPASIETVTMSKTVDLGNYGYVIWNVKLSYNATTQKTRLASCTYTSNLNKTEYPLLKIKSVKLSIDIGTYFNPKTGFSVKITYSTGTSTFSKSFTFSSTTVD